MAPLVSEHPFFRRAKVLEQGVFKQMEVNDTSFLVAYPLLTITTSSLQPIDITKLLHSFVMLFPGPSFIKVCVQNRNVRKPYVCSLWAACCAMGKLFDLDPQGRWFDPNDHDKICTAVGPLSQALIPTLLQGVCLLLSLINC